MNSSLPRGQHKLIYKDPVCISLGHIIAAFRYGCRVLHIFNRVVSEMACCSAFDRTQLLTPPEIWSAGPCRQDVCTCVADLLEYTRNGNRMMPRTHAFVWLIQQWRAPSKLHWSGAASGEVQFVSVCCTFWPFIPQSTCWPRIGCFVLLLPTVQECCINRNTFTVGVCLWAGEMTKL